LKRAWFLIAGLWALVFLANGATKAHGVGLGDVLLAIAPLAIGFLLLIAVRFVATGSVVTGTVKRRRLGPVLVRR
jgi:hypothetical protein